MVKLKFNNFEIKLKLIYFLILIYSFFVFVNLGRDSLWRDEAEVGLIAKNVLKYGYPLGVDGDQRFVSYISTNANGVDVMHGWLQYYITALFFLVFGTSEFVARLPFAIFGVMSILIVYLLGKDLFDDRAGLYASIFMMGSFLFYIGIRQTRYYSLLMFFSISSFYFYWKFLQHKNSGLMLFFSLLFLSHTHFLSFLAVFLSVLLHFSILNISTFKNNSFEGFTKFFHFCVYTFPVVFIFLIFFIFFKVYNSPANLHSFTFNMLYLVYFILLLGVFNHSPLLFIFLGVPFFALRRSFYLFLAVVMFFLFYLLYSMKVLVVANPLSVNTFFVFVLFFIIMFFNCVYWYFRNKSLFFLLYFYVFSLFLIPFAMPVGVFNVYYLFHLIPLSSLILGFLLTKISLRKSIVFVILIILAFTNTVPIFTFSLPIIQKDKNLYEPNREYYVSYDYSKLPENLLKKPERFYLASYILNDSEKDAHKTTYIKNVGREYAMNLASRLRDRPVSHYLNFQFFSFQILREIKSKFVDSTKALTSWFQNNKIDGKRIFIPSTGISMSVRFNVNATIIDQDFNVPENFDCSRPYDFVVTDPKGEQFYYEPPFETPKVVLDKIKTCKIDNVYSLMDILKYDTSEGFGLGQVYDETAELKKNNEELSWYIFKLNDIKK